MLYSIERVRQLDRLIDPEPFKRSKIESVMRDEDAGELKESVLRW